MGRINVGELVLSMDGEFGGGAGNGRSWDLSHDAKPPRVKSIGKRSQAGCGTG